MIRFIKKSLLVCAVALPLSACGDGWDTIRVTDTHAFGPERTAGGGIAYVRAKMLPEKDFVFDTQGLEKIKSERRPDLVKANDVFEKALIK